MIKLYAWLGTAIGKVVSYALAALILLLVLWWVKDSIYEAIRAPVVAEMQKAVDANASLVLDNERLLRANTKLSDALVARSRFEAKVDERLGKIEGDFQRLKASNPAVKAWAETVIPPEALQ